MLALQISIIVLSVAVTALSVAVILAIRAIRAQREQFYSACAHMSRNIDQLQREMCEVREQLYYMKNEISEDLEIWLEQS